MHNKLPAVSVVERFPSTAIGGRCLRRFAGVVMCYYRFGTAQRPYVVGAVWRDRGGNFVFR